VKIKDQATKQIMQAPFHCPIRAVLRAFVPSWWNLGRAVNRHYLLFTGRHRFVKQTMPTMLA